MNLAELFRHETDLLTVAAGHTLLKEGEQGEEMYVLMSGKADIVVRGEVVERAEPGAILGEMSMLDDSPHSATVVAETECRVLPVSRERFRFLTQQTPNFALQVMRVMAGRLRNMDARM